MSEDEREFVLDHWREGGSHVNGAAGAFFTPTGLAADLAIDAGGGRVIDLCAGIGALSFYVHHRSKWPCSIAPELKCLEINPRYVEIGRKILPEARWINADVFDWQSLDLGRFDVAIGNPPWGRSGAPGKAPATPDICSNTT